MADRRFEASEFEPIRLAREPAFTLGAIEVRPATRQVVRAELSETIEPRVMQVLVALARGDGAVVSRDELIALCWDGRIVGEGAINRVISHVRGLGAGIANGSFAIETIARVGYRMVPGDTVPDQAPIGPAVAGAPTPVAITPAAISRRAGLALIGGAAALAATGGAAWLATARHTPSPAVVELYRKGLDAQRQGRDEQTEQAITFLEEAVRLDPGYSAAWGALALSYRHRLENDPTVDQAVVAGWISAAAERALRLDPGNADARVATLLIHPSFRNWTTLDRDFRAGLRQYPDHWLLRGTFGRLMFDVGRWRDGIDPFRANVARDPFLPVSRVMLASGLWHAGKWQEAEAMIDSAFARWPKHPAIWTQRIDFLTHTGRPAAAIALAANAAGRPIGLSEPLLEAMIATARAIDSSARRDADAAVALAEALVRTPRGAAAIPRTVQALATFGALDRAFALLDARYLDRPADGVPPVRSSALTRRATDLLFVLPTAPLRADPRFATLTAAIGLDDYWRATASLPDYRRA